MICRVDKDFSDAKRDNWTSQPLKGQITAYDSEKGDKAKIMLMKMIFLPSIHHLQR